MVDKYKQSGGEVFYQMTHEEAMIISARFPLDFMQLTTSQQLTTRNFKPDEASGNQAIGRFEMLCNALSLEIHSPQISK